MSTWKWAWQYSNLHHIVQNVHCTMYTYTRSLQILNDKRRALDHSTITEWSVTQLVLLNHL